LDEELDEILGRKVSKSETKEEEVKEKVKEKSIHNWKGFWKEQLGKNVDVKLMNGTTINGILKFVDFQHMGLVIEVEENYVILRGNMVENVVIAKVG